MAVQTQITLTHGKETIATIQNKLLKTPSVVKSQLVAMRNFFHAAVGVDRAVKAVVQVNSGDAVAASGTITLSSLAAADTVTVGTQTFTCETSGATGNNQFNKGGTDTLSAVALAAAINAHPSLSPYVSASPAAAIVTVTSLIPGDIGNNVALAISAHGSVSAAHLASGANATTYSTQNTYHSGV